LRRALIVLLSRAWFDQIGNGVRAQVLRYPVYPPFIRRSSAA